MKFTLSWLKRFLDTQSSLVQIIDALTSLGLEVEGVEDRSLRLQGFKVAKIIQAEPHPNANKLRVCKVDDGEQLLQIVCGAPNAREGIKVVLACIGTTIPANQMIITHAKIRDIESMGMLCSAQELGLEGCDDGIIELDDDAQVGQDFARYLELDDPVIELSVTPNRGDCFGVYGIARELHAKGIGSLRPLEIAQIKPSCISTLPIKLESSLCSAIWTCEIDEIENKPSPRWLINLLKNSGISPISAIVDVTNYISHSFAQPMHAFDADKLAGGVIVRNALDGEHFIALNKQEYSLHQDDLVIADKNQAQCLAGVIGGQLSSCLPSTKKVLLEAGFFDKTAITKTSRRHNIITSAKMRFERYVDDHMREQVFKIACGMIYQLCGGKFAEINFLGKLSKRVEFVLSYEIFAQKIGIEIRQDEIRRILQNLGYEIKIINQQQIQVTVPSWRCVEVVETIVEDVLRIYGYDNVVLNPLLDLLLTKVLPNSYLNGQILRNTMASLGYKEVITWSFMSSKRAQYFGNLNSDLKLLNPISSHLDYMRSSVIPNLLDAILASQNMGQKDLKLFEIGPIFSGINPEDEQQQLVAAITGDYSELNLYGSRQVDIYDIKGDLTFALRQFNINAQDLELHKTDKVFYHPNISCDFSFAGKKLGSFGAIHPKLLKEYDISSAVFALELDIDFLAKEPNYIEYIKRKHQVIERDFAFVVDEHMPAEQLVKVVRGAEKTIVDVKIFDVYQGANLSEGKKSIAINVSLLPQENLSAQELEDVCQKIITSVKDELAAELRG